MSTIYNSLSEVYEMMYQTFINYDDEFVCYSNFINKYQSKSVVELGCGTGNLASRFISNGYNYTGLDLNKSMLDIAKIKNPKINLAIGDMRNFKLAEKKDVCIMAGRTISYLISNQDVIDNLNSIQNNLNQGGIVCFDCIDAEKFIPTIKDGKQITHHAVYGNRKFRRESFWSVPDSSNWIFHWKSEFYEEFEKQKLRKLGEDESMIRSFSKNEMSLFLENCNFKILEIVDRPSYAFDTFVIVAQKNS